MQPITLSPVQLQAVLDCVTSASKQNGARRIAVYLGEHARVRTRTLNVECSCGNLSDQISVHINPHIAHLGLYIACNKPPQQFKNKFSEHTNEHQWSFYQAQEAANEPDYDASELADELDTLAPNLPDLPADDWERTMSAAGVE